MRNSLCLLLLLLICISCGTNQKQEKFRDKYMFSVKMGNSNFTENISFNDEMGLMIIPVTIEGKVYDFLFDTGSVTMVSKELQGVLNEIEEDKTQFTITDASGNKNQANFSILPEITIGNIDFLHVGVNVQDLSNFETRCISVDGIIGANLMRKCSWKINFPDKTITFSDNVENLQITDPYINFPFEENFSGNPRTKLKWAQWDFWAMWDTGYNSSIQIPDSLFLKSDKYKNTPLVSGKGLTTATLYGKEHEIDKQYSALLDSILFIEKMRSDRTFVANYVLEDEPVLIAPYPASPLIGTKFMKPAEEVLLDWENHKIVFKENLLSNSINTFGFAPFKIENSVQIVSIWDDSPAQKQGLRVGDTIVSFYGKSVEDITLKEWCKQFKKEKENKVVSFTVKISDTIKSVSFEKYPLFVK